MNPTLNAKNRIGAVVGLLGAAALIVNVGLNYKSPDGNDSSFRGASAVDGGEARVDRMLSIPEEYIEVSQLNDRTLQVSVNALTEGYYTDLGAGVCRDISARLFDHVENGADTAARCARRCSRQILLEEHRGFEYDATNKLCRCLFDNHMIPRPVKMKSSSYVIDETDAVGEISSVDPSPAGAATFKCYKKVETMLGSPLADYTEKDCAEDDLTVKDVACFVPVFTPDSCSKKCARFKLMDAFLGFSVTQDEGVCKCLFVDDEMPTQRWLSSSGAVMEKARNWQSRWDAMLDKNEARCFDKNAAILADAAPAQRLAPSTTNRVFINEFHIRNYDVNEPFVRVLAPLGTSTSGWSVVAYQGRDGGVHSTYDLDAGGASAFTNSDGNPDWGYVTVDLDSTFFRKGKSGSDGMALVGPGDSCVQFFSYAHIASSVRSFAANEGPCDGVASNPIAATEERETPVGESIQLRGGPGNKYDDFVFAGPFVRATGTANPGQTLTAP